MSGKQKIRVDKRLYRQARQLAGRRGYACVEDLVEHLLQRELRQDGPPELDSELEQRLKGLGYL
jgi:hypothetical protein